MSGAVSKLDCEEVSAFLFLVLHFSVAATFRRLYGSVRRHRKKRTAVQPTAKLPINYDPGHTHTYPFVCLSISLPPLSPPSAVSQSPPPVVNKNRSAKLQVEPWSLRPVCPAYFRILFFGRPSGAMSEFLRRASLATVQLLRIIVQRGNWLRFPFNIHGD